MKCFNQQLHEAFWRELAEHPEWDETDLLAIKGEWEYKPLLMARNNNLACEYADGDCNSCPFEGQGGHLSCLARDGSSLMARWRAAVIVVKSFAENENREAFIRKNFLFRIESLRWGVENLRDAFDDLLQESLSMDEETARKTASMTALEIALFPVRPDVRVCALAPFTRKLRKTDILTAIYAIPQGTVFSAADIPCNAPASLIGWHLCALAHLGIIQRVSHGHYTHGGEAKEEFKPLKQRILDKMRSDPYREFAREDFYSLAEADTISQQLSRMAKNHRIIRTNRGRYRLKHDLRKKSDFRRDTNAR